MAERRGMGAVAGLAAPLSLPGFDGNRVGQTSPAAAPNGLPRWGGPDLETLSAPQPVHRENKTYSALTSLLNSALPAKSTNWWCFTLGSWPFLRSLFILLFLILVD